MGAGDMSATIVVLWPIFDLENPRACCTQQSEGMQLTGARFLTNETESIFFQGRSDIMFKTNSVTQKIIYCFGG